MNFAMRFYKVADEADNWCSFVSATYQNATKARGAPLAAEDVFPDLCHAAKNCGAVEPLEVYCIPADPFYEEVQIQRLCGFVRFLFKVAPHMVPALVPTNDIHTDTTPMPLVSKGETCKALSAVIHKSPEVDRNAEAVASAERADFLIDESRSRKLSPYKVEQELTRAEVIRIIGEALFVYSDGYYAHISSECLRRLIMRDCRKAVEAAGTPRLIEEVYKFLLCDPDLFRQEENADEHLIAFDNGVLDIQSGNLYAHSSAYNIFYKVNTWWGDQSPHPYFDMFMDDIAGADNLLKQRILECIGYCLSGDTHSKLFFVFQGVGDSGKTVLAKFIRACINADATTALDITKLGDRFAVANLVGKQLCLSMDIASTPLNAGTTATFKSITGGDPITADVKYSPHITFFNKAKFILGTNHPLLTQDDDPAFFSRAITIPFNYGIPHDRRNPHLLDALDSERASIVYDALQAYRTLRDRNYQFSGHYPINEMFKSCKAIPAPSIEALVQEFVQEFCMPAPEHWVFVEDLFTKFHDIYPAASISDLKFGTQIISACQALGFEGICRGIKKRKKSRANPQATLIGLTLKEDLG